MFCSESGEKSASDQNSSKLICSWILMWESTADALFHWRKSYYGLWTLCILVKSVLMLDLFHLLSSPDVNWWTGVLWIIVMFLSDSHSDGTHSLQSIHCWDTDADLQITFLQIWVIFGWTILLSTSNICMEARESWWTRSIDECIQCMSV